MQRGGKLKGGLEAGRALLLQATGRTRRLGCPLVRPRSPT